MSQSYGSADQDRYLLERSQDISSREMQELNDALQHERDTLESRVSERTAALAASEARFRSFTSLGSDWYWEQDAEFPLHRDQRQFRRRRPASPSKSISAARTGTFPASRRRTAAGRACARGSSRTRRSTTSSCGASIRCAAPTFAAISGEPVFDADGALRRLSRHRARSDAAEAGRGKHQPARALRHADQSLQSRRVLRAARTTRCPSRAATATCSPCCSSTSTASRTSTTPSAI